MTATMRKSQRDVQAELDAHFKEKRAAADQRYDAMLDRIITGETPPPSETESVLADAGKTPDDLQRDLQLRADRESWAAEAARLNARREALAEIEQQRANELAEHQRRMAEFDADAGSARLDVDDSEYARKKLLKTSREVCPALAGKRRDVDRAIGKLQRILAEPTPTLERAAGSFQPTAGEREHVERRAAAQQSRQAQAQEAISFLEPLSDALKRLALTAMPTDEQLVTILDKHADAVQYV